MVIGEELCHLHLQFNGVDVPREGCVSCYPTDTTSPATSALIDM